MASMRAWTLAVVIIAASWSGCISEGPGQDEPGLAEPGIEDGSGPNGASAPPEDETTVQEEPTANSTAGAPADSNDDARPFLMTGCSNYYTSIYGPIAPVNDALPEGWVAAEAAAGVGAYRGLWLFCEASSRDNATFEGPSNMLFVFVNVQPPDAYWHGGGRDLFVFWTLADQDVGGLREQRVPAFNGTFMRAPDGSSFLASSDSHRYEVHDVETQQANDIVSEDAFFHFRHDGAILSMEFRASHERIASFGGTGHINGGPWSGDNGPLTGSSYVGTVALLPSFDAMEDHS